MSERMTVWWALCRREWLEHRAALAWLPLALVALLVFLTLIASFSGPEVVDSAESGLTTDGSNQDAPGAVEISMILLFFLRPFTWLYFGVTVFLLLGTLFDERKDRTILFWKSMPVSDTQVVLSKLFVLVFVGALISLVLILVTQLYLVALGVANGLAGWGVHGEGVWNSAGLGQSSLDWVAGYLSLLFWWLPIFGWLLLVSSIAPRMPILWAILVPTVIMAIEKLAFDSGRLATSTLGHLTLSGAADLQSSTTDVSHANPLQTLWTSSSMWLGIAAGILFIALTIFFRRRNNEL